MEANAWNQEIMRTLIKLSGTSLIKISDFRNNFRHGNTRMLLKQHLLQLSPHVYNHYKLAYCTELL